MSDNISLPTYNIVQRFVRCVQYIGLLIVAKTALFLSDCTASIYDAFPLSRQAADVRVKARERKGIRYLIPNQYAS